MGLGRDEEIVVFCFDKFDKGAVGGSSGDFEAAGFDFIFQGEVDFVTMAMALGNFEFFVDFRDF